MLKERSAGEDQRWVLSKVPVCEGDRGAGGGGSRWALAVPVGCLDRHFLALSPFLLSRHKEVMEFASCFFLYVVVCIGWQELYRMCAGLLFQTWEVSWVPMVDFGRVLRELRWKLVSCRFCRWRCGFPRLSSGFAFLIVVGLSVVAEKIDRVDWKAFLRTENVIWKCCTCKMCCCRHGRPRQVLVCHPDASSNFCWCCLETK